MARKHLWSAFGLAALALVVGAAYVYGAWVPRHWAYLAPLAAAGFLAALACGVRQSPSTRAGPRLAAGFVWAAALAALLALPAAVRTVRINAAASRIPAPPHSRLIRRTIQTVVPYNGLPEFRLVYAATDPDEYIETAFLDRLATDGWQPDLDLKAEEWFVGPVADGGLPSDLLSGGDVLAFRRLKRGSARISVSVIWWEDTRQIVIDGPVPRRPNWSL